MKPISFLLAVATLGGVLASVAPAPGQVAQQSPPVFVTKIPAGYRDWKLVSVAHEAGNLNSIGAVLGNDVAIKAFRDKTLPYPDGTMIAALHWSHTASAENNAVFGDAQSFVAGAPTNAQFMIKDSKKYAATGGWGFGHFNKDGKPGDAAFMKPCYPCHAMASRDGVFTQYAPSYAESPQKQCSQEHSRFERLQLGEPSCLARSPQLTTTPVSAQASLAQPPAP